VHHIPWLKGREKRERSTYQPEEGRGRARERRERE
jgi:hypothetical protein